MYYKITEKEVDILNQNKKQLVDLVNVLNTAMSAEGKMAKSFVIQIAQNLSAIRPIVITEEITKDVSHE
ncbi:MAG: hypothetical protein WC917_04620 [Bacilli bacterium]|jgi:hypothetical protein